MLEDDDFCRYLLQAQKKSFSSEGKRIGKLQDFENRP